MATIYQEVEIDIDLEDYLEEISTETLRQELQARGDSEYAFDKNYVLNQLWECRRYTPEKFDELFNNLCYEHIGKVT